jgi:hypothetical protein
MRVQRRHNDPARYPKLALPARRVCAAGVRGLRVTGNATKKMAILAGGSPTHCETVRSLEFLVENSFPAELFAEFRLIS